MYIALRRREYLLLKFFLIYEIHIGKRQTYEKIPKAETLSNLCTSKSIDDRFPILINF